MMSGLGFPAFLGIILGLFEFIGGILMIIGLFSNYVAAGFIVIMLGALFTVHLSQGYMASELVILLLVMSIAVMVSYNWKKLWKYIKKLKPETFYLCPRLVFNGACILIVFLIV